MMGHIREENILNAWLQKTGIHGSMIPNNLLQIFKTMTETKYPDFLSQDN